MTSDVKPAWRNRKTPSKSPGEFLKQQRSPASVWEMEAQRNTHMPRRMSAATCTVLLAAALLTSCGSSSTPKSPGSGSLFTFIGDVPFCDVLSFRVLATGSSKPTLFLRIAGTTSNVVVIPSTAAVKLNFAELRDFSTVLNLASVPAGTYDQATLVMSGPTLEVYDPTQSPPVRTITATLPTTAPAIPIRPNLVINPPVNGKSQVSALSIDFDLLHSLLLDSSGQLTGTINPVMTATPVIASSSVGFGEMDDVLGIVTRVDTFSSNASFIGDIGLQLLQGTGVALTVNLNSNTVVNGVVSCGPPALAAQTCGSGALSRIVTDSFAEVGGYVDVNGNFIARSIEVEDQEYPNTNANKFAFLGDVLSVTKDSSGNVTQFMFYIRDEEPDTGAPPVPLGSVVLVNPSASTSYAFSSRATNFTDLTLDQTGLAPGEQVVVHGVFTKAATSTGSTVAPLTTIAPDKIYLKLQTHQGTFSTLVQAANDNKTGAFSLATCATVFNKAPILVLTNGDTNFLNVAGLSQLTPEATLLVKGLLFYDSAGGIITGNTMNQVSVPAGTLVLVAKQVHQVL